MSAEELKPHIEDALNELEFLTGDQSTTYGQLRATLGHPEPWSVNYVEIGNEDNYNDGLASYQEYRFQMFYDAIKEKYPHMTIIASTSEKSMNLTGDQVGDFHRYSTPDGIMEQFGLFDNFEHRTIVGMF